MALVTFSSSPVTWLWVPAPACYYAQIKGKQKRSPQDFPCPQHSFPLFPTQPVSRLAFLYKCIYNAGASGTLRGLIKLKFRSNFLLIH